MTTNSLYLVKLLEFTQVTSNESEGGNYMFGNSPSINDKLIKMIDLVDQKANINQSDIQILKNVLTESLEHINQLNARVDKVEKTLVDTVDLLNEVADMLSSK